MEKIILLDTSILIEHFRKKDKSKTTLYKLSEKNYRFSISTVTYYEIFIGWEKGDALFIAATALSKGIPIATLNKKHFERIAGLKVI
jgi:predicted nucleic acid-binding protein